MEILQLFGGLDSEVTAGKLINTNYVDSSKRCLLVFVNYLGNWIKSLVLQLLLANF